MKAGDKKLLELIGRVKVCSICNEQKPLSQFYRRRKGSDALRSECKSCHGRDIEQLKLDHPENITWQPAGTSNAGRLLTLIEQATRKLSRATRPIERAEGI